jgi:hypothetical protein
VTDLRVNGRAAADQMEENQTVRSRIHDLSQRLAEYGAPFDAKPGATWEVQLSNDLAAETVTFGDGSRVVIQMPGPSISFFAGSGGARIEIKPRRDAQHGE